MSTPRIDARSLFAAARDDGPDAEARDAVLRRVALVTGMGAAAASASAASASAPPTAGAAGTASSPAAGASAATHAGGAGAAKGASAGGLKLVALGGLIGAVSTALGVVVTMVVAEPEGVVVARSGAGSVAAGAPVARVVEPRVFEPTAGARLKDPAPRGRGPTEEEHGAPAVAASGVGSVAPVLSAGPVGGDLAEEARLVTDARRALVAGDPARALALVRGAHALRSRVMEPEELGLEARALHALGRADEAAAVELDLRRRFPEHALAR